MFSDGCLLSLYAVTPVHCGSGASFGAIDLPVQREAHTNLPLLPPPSIKGVLKDFARDLKPGDPRIEEVFGPDKGSDHAGAISPTDGRLLLFPVRASTGVFVWATCPFILRRLARDASLVANLASLVKDLGAGLNADGFTPQAGHCLVASKAVIGARIVLEEDRFDVDELATPQPDSLLTAIGRLVGGGSEYKFICDRFKTHLLVLPDDDLVRLARTATEVVTRNRLNEQKTTTGGVGNMWVEESVPSDALFYSVVLATASRRPPAASSTPNPSGTAPAPSKKDAKEIVKDLKELVPDGSHIQIGGDETVGRGWMHLTWVS